MDLDELERVARAATPGPWHVDEDDRPRMEWNRHIMSSPLEAVCFMAHSGETDPARDEATAKHIAAFNPTTVLKLLAVVKASGYVAFSNGFDAGLPDKMEALRAAWKELKDAHAR